MVKKIEWSKKRKLTVIARTGRRRTRRSQLPRRRPWKEARAMTAFARSVAIASADIVFEDEWLAVIDNPAGVYCDVLLTSFPCPAVSDLSKLGWISGRKQFRDVIFPLSPLGHLLIAKAGTSQDLAFLVGEVDPISVYLSPPTLIRSVIYIYDGKVIPVLLVLCHAMVYMAFTTREMTTMIANLEVPR
ncbi:hypothetical protein SORBI_3010G231050 [Sorghum bicolor]|uniref:Uncharacterized protein n=1 Tax=Sorghum bicolor TaxID=4558 RepID=A0A1W0VUE4_SORBI|nr:hypothetical protein SORBI_3010G231050 [Sorghum bicolor]